MSNYINRLALVSKCIRHSMWNVIPSMVLVCVFIVTASRAQEPSGLGPTVRIDPLPMNANSTVVFNIKPLGLSPYKVIAKDRFIDVQMQGDIKAVIDRATMSSDATTRTFSFHLFLNHNDQFLSKVYEYQIEEDPSGVFNDAEKGITIDVASGNSPPSVGTASVPLHSPYGPSDAFDISQVTANVQNLHTGSSTSLSITLKSNLQLGASLGALSATATCDLCLQKPISIQSTATQLRPQDTITLTIITVPNMWKAMSASSHPASSKYDAMLNLVIPLSADGGTQWPQRIPIPIKFSPPAPIVATSVFTGVLIGAFLRMLLLFF